MTATGDLNSIFGFDSEGRLVIVSYPAAGPAYTFAYDTLSRLSQLTDQHNTVLVNNLQYQPSGQIAHMTFFGDTETRQYNANAQVLGITVTNSAMNTLLNMAYGYSSSQNNGKISSQTDGMSLETVDYA